MKLIDALRSVIRSDENHTNPGKAEFCESVGISDDYNVPYDLFETGLKAYWLSKHVCTDTWVGEQAVFLNDELVAYTNQTARKSDYRIQYVSAEAFKQVMEFIASIRDADEEHTGAILNQEELERDIGETYRVDYEAQLLTKTGLHDGRKVTVIGHMPANYKDMMMDHLRIKYDDTKEEVLIAICDFHIPLHVTSVGW